MTKIEYLRIYSDTVGLSHFGIKDINLESNAPPAVLLNTSRLKSADACIFLELPVGWYGDWHPTPVRQFLILMTGGCEFEISDHQQNWGYEVGPRKGPGPGPAGDR